MVAVIVFWCKGKTSAHAGFQWSVPRTMGALGLYTLLLRGVRLWHGRARIYGPCAVTLLPGCRGGGQPLIRLFPATATYNSGIRQVE